jgi:hypothetical protein
MTPIEAAKLLEIAPDATPEQLEARFLELRARLEDKIAKAPTPGLKAKYRESLEQITAAFEILTLAADSSALPVLKKEAGDRRPETGGPSSREAPSAAPHSAIRNPHSEVRNPQSGKKSSKEFLIVALIAVAVLAAGGWFVMKTRADNARLVAEAKAEVERKVATEKAEQDRKAEAARAEKAEQERKAEEARLAAEAQRKADADEKVRLAAEAERVSKQLAQQRSQLAELKVLWSAIEQTAQAEGQRVDALRNEERELTRQNGTSAAKRTRAQREAQEALARWLREGLPRHPARIAMVQAEELLAGRSPDEAQAAIQRSRTELEKLEAELADKREELFALTTSVTVAPEPAESSWEITDAYGDVHRGKGPRDVDGLPFGPTSIRFQLAGWPDKPAEFTLVRGEKKTFSVKFTAPRVKVESIPAGAEVFADGVRQGITPVTFTLPAPKQVQIEVRKDGHRPTVWAKINATEGFDAAYVAQLINRSTPTVGIGFWRGAGQVLTINHLLDYSPAARAGLAVGDRIDAIFDGTQFASPAALSILEVLKLLSPDTGKSVRLKITSKATSASREVSLISQAQGEIEDSRFCTIHYLRGVVLLELKLQRDVTIADKSFTVGEWNRASVRVAPGRHRLWLEGVGEYFVDVKPGEEIYVRGTMGGFKTLTREEGEQLGRKLHHVSGSMTAQPERILP